MNGISGKTIKAIDNALGVLSARRNGKSSTVEALKKSPRGMHECKCSHRMMNHLFGAPGENGKCLISACKCVLFEGSHVGS